MSNLLRCSWVLGCVGSAMLVAACGGSTVSAIEPQLDGGADTGVVGHHDGSVKDATSADATHKKDAVSAPDVFVSNDAPPAADVTVPDATGFTDALAPADAPVVDAPAANDAEAKHDAGTKTDAETDAGKPVDSGVSCPAMAPANFGACTTVGEACVYPTEDCTCGATKVWTCNACPATQPTTGSTCTGGASINADTCTYGATECECEMGKWACGACPGTEPANKSTCTVAGQSCTYAADDCRCGLSVGGEEWTCTASCPATVPTPGGTCTVAATTDCSYGTQQCFCRATGWFCN